MKRTSYEDMACSVARTLEVIGEWWTPLILRDVFLGLTRFDVIQEDLGISRKVLAKRLDDLVAHGVLERIPYQDNPVRHDYVLTEMGADLAPVILALQAWGDRWVHGPDRAPVLVRHDACGATSGWVPACAACGEPMTPADVTLLPGPGLTEGTAADAGQIAAALSRLASTATTPGDPG